MNKCNAPFHYLTSLFLAEIKEVERKRFKEENRRDGHLGLMQVAALGRFGKRSVGESLRVGGSKLWAFCRNMSCHQEFAFLLTDFSCPRPISHVTTSLFTCKESYFWPWRSVKDVKSVSEDFGLVDEEFDDFGLVGEISTFFFNFWVEKWRLTNNSVFSILLITGAWRTVGGLFSARRPLMQWYGDCSVCVWRSVGIHEGLHKRWGHSSLRLWGF